MTSNRRNFLKKVGSVGIMTSALGVTGVASASSVRVLRVEETAGLSYSSSSEGYIDYHIAVNSSNVEHAEHGNESSEVMYLDEHGVTDIYGRAYASNDSGDVFYINDGGNIGFVEAEGYVHRDDATPMDRKNIPKLTIDISDGSTSGTSDFTVKLREKSGYDCIMKSKYNIDPVGSIQTQNDCESGEDYEGSASGQGYIQAGGTDTWAVTGDLNHLDCKPLGGILSMGRY